MYQHAELEPLLALPKKGRFGCGCVLIAQAAASLCYVKTENAVYSLFLPPATDAAGQPTGPPRKAPVWTWVDCDGASFGGQVVHHSNDGDEAHAPPIGAIRVDKLYMAKGIDPLAMICLFNIWRQRKEGATQEIARRVLVGAIG